MGAHTPDLFGDKCGQPSENVGYNAAFNDVYDKLDFGIIADTFHKSQDSDPTCSGALAHVQLTNLEAATTVPTPPASGSSDNSGNTATPRQGDRNPEDKPIRFDQEPQLGFFQSLWHNVLDQALKADVQKILEGLGSNEFKDRERFQKMAERLPVAALKHLKDGLNSENPEVRMRAEAAIRKINNQNLDRCLGPMKAASQGFSDLLKDLDNTDATRKKFEDQLKLVDSLNFTPEELRAAYNHLKMPNENDPKFLGKLLEKLNLRNDPEQLKTQIRLWYAGWLAETGSPQDKERAVTLLQEAVRMNKWQNDPRWIIGVVDSLGGPDKLPKEIKDAYEDSRKRYQLDMERRQVQPPAPTTGRLSDNDSTRGVRHGNP